MQSVTQDSCGLVSVRCGVARVTGMNCRLPSRRIQSAYPLLITAGSVGGHM